MRNSQRFAIQMKSMSHFSRTLNKKQCFPFSKCGLRFQPSQVREICIGSTPFSPLADHTSHQPHYNIISIF